MGGDRFRPTPGRYRGDCSTLETLGLWDQSMCCGSCHLDCEDGDYSFSELELANGEWFEVCCAAKRLLDPEEVLARLSARGKEQKEND